MTDLTYPAENGAELRPDIGLHVMQNTGTGGWVVDGVDLADDISALDSSGVAGFSVASTSGLDLTLEGGEAYHIGWLCRDRQTTVTLPDDSTTVIYAGFSVGYTIDYGNGETAADHDNIIIGESDSFGGSDPQMPLYEVTTSGGSIDSTDFLPPYQPPFSYDGESDHTDIEGSVRTGGNLEVPGAVNAAGPLSGSSASVGGDIDVEDGVVVYDSSGDYGAISLYNNRELGAQQAHYLVTSSPHLPTVIRNGSTDTIVADDGQVDVPNGDLYNQGDGVPRVTEDWDEGTSGRLVKETPNGDTIEYVDEA